MYFWYIKIGKKMSLNQYGNKYTVVVNQLRSKYEKIITTFRRKKKTPTMLPFSTSSGWASGQNWQVCTLGCHLVFERNRVWSTSWALLGVGRAKDLSGWFCLREASGIIRSDSTVWSSNICPTNSPLLSSQPGPLCASPSHSPRDILDQINHCYLIIFFIQPVTLL